MTIAAAGNVAINAPSGGNTLTVTCRTDSAVGTLFTSANKAIRVNLTNAATAIIDAVDSTGTLSFQPLTLNGSTLALQAGANDRLIISATGNLTVNAPSSGIALTLTGANGSDTVVLNGGTSGSFRVTERGLPYGTSIHNNAGAVTGTTNQYIASGTYTPTPINVSNTSALSARLQWLRVGNLVTVSGRVSYTITTGAASTEFRIPLPIAVSGFTDSGQLGGVGVETTSGAGGPVMSVTADVVNEDATARFQSGSTGARASTVHFTYEVL
jgi:hypothetical protein